jgi:hypothetical protein
LWFHSEALEKGHVQYSVCGRFFEDYLRNLTCWEKSKYAVVTNSSKSIKKIVEFSSRKKPFGLCLSIKVKNHEKCGELN